MESWTVSLRLVTPAVPCSPGIRRSANVPSSSPLVDPVASGEGAVHYSRADAKKYPLPNRVKSLTAAMGLRKSPSHAEPKPLGQTATSCLPQPEIIGYFTAPVPPRRCIEAQFTTQSSGSPYYRPSNRHPDCHQPTRRVRDGSRKPYKARL